MVHNPTKSKKDTKTRDALIDKTAEKLNKIINFKRNYKVSQLQDKVSKITNKYGCEKFITYSIKESPDGYATIQYAIASEKVEKARLYDGFYMIESTSSVTKGEDSVSLYKDLQLVERAFNSVKNHIEIRPVFHYKESRIKGHIFACFMSYFLLHKFKQICADLLLEHSLNKLLTELTNIHRGYLKIEHYCFQKITKMSDLGHEICSRFTTL